MKLKIVAALVVLCLSACTTTEQIIARYDDAKSFNFSKSETRTIYRIADQPKEKRLLISSRSGKPLSSRNAAYAADEWLASRGRLCLAKAATKVTDHRYEVRYRCI
jgi:hypothetical protein